MIYLTIAVGVICVTLPHWPQAAQIKVIGAKDKALSFEMFCALLNNNVECHDQSLEFVEEAKV